MFSRATYEQRTNGKITSFVPAKPAEAEGPSKENCDVQQSTKTPEKAITARSPSKHVTVDARDPNFIREYYNRYGPCFDLSNVIPFRSRLHLISTLGQEMKDFISGVRLDSSYRCISRSQLEQYRSGMLDRFANLTNLWTLLLLSVKKHFLLVIVFSKCYATGKSPLTGEVRSE